MNYAMTDLNRVYLTASLVAVPLFVLWSFNRRKAIDVAKVPPKTVIVVGGSYAGITVAHGLLKQVPNVKVILINPSADFYFNIAAPRIVAKPDAFTREKYMYSIAELFEKYPANVKARFELVLGKATAIDLEGKTVSVSLTADASDKINNIAYDYLVIASGSTAKATLGQGSLKVPFTPSMDGNTDLEIQRAQDVLQAASSIVIGGGGAVGVEFAAELADKKRDANITMVTPTDKVLPGIKDSPRNKATRLLKAKGIQILTGVSVLSAADDTSSGKWTITLSDGKVLTADAYVSAAGVVPNNEFIPASLLNEAGWVDVDHHFRASKIPATANVYAVGDITQNPQRLASRMAAMTAVVVSNLKADIVGRGKRGTYDFSKLGVLLGLPIGSSDGTGQIGSIVVPGFAIAFMKGKDYLTGRAKTLVSG